MEAQIGLQRCQVDLAAPFVHDQEDAVDPVEFLHDFLAEAFAGLQKLQNGGGACWRHLDISELPGQFLQRGRGDFQALYGSAGDNQGSAALQALEGQVLSVGGEGDHVLNGVGLLNRQLDVLGVGLIKGWLQCLAGAKSLWLDRCCRLLVAAS